MIYAGNSSSLSDAFKADPNVRLPKEKASQIEKPSIYKNE